MQDSLNPRRGKVCYYLLMIIGISGLLYVLIWTLTTPYCSDLAMILSYAGAVLSMIMICLGINGLKELKERAKS